MLKRYHNLYFYLGDILNPLALENERGFFKEIPVSSSSSNYLTAPNVLKIVGISDRSSKNRFILFHGSK